MVQCFRLIYASVICLLSVHVQIDFIHGQQLKYPEIRMIFITNRQLIYHIESEPKLSIATATKRTPKSDRRHGGNLYNQNTFNYLYKNPKRPYSLTIPGSGDTYVNK